MPLSVYPEDLTASLVGNYVVGETKVFSTAEDRIFVPTGAPFYLKDLQVRDSATNQLLTPSVDYYAMQPDKDAMMASVKAVMTVIWVTRPQTAGVTIRYRAVGGDYQNLSAVLIEFLDNTPVGALGAPTWGTILNKPATFPPSSHNHLPSDWRGYTEVILLLEQIRVALVSGDRPTISSVYQYIETNISNSVNNYISEIDLQQPIVHDPLVSGLTGTGIAGDPIKLNLELIDERYPKISDLPITQIGDPYGFYLPLSAGYFSITGPKSGEFHTTSMYIEGNGDLLLLLPSTNGEVSRVVYGRVKNYVDGASLDNYTPTDRIYRPPGLAANEHIQGVTSSGEGAMIASIWQLVPGDTEETFKEHAVIILNGTLVDSFHLINRLGDILLTVSGVSDVDKINNLSPVATILDNDDIYITMIKSYEAIYLIGYTEGGTPGVKVWGEVTDLDRHVRSINAVTRSVTDTYIDSRDDIFLFTDVMGLNDTSGGSFINKLDENIGHEPWNKLTNWTGGGLMLTRVSPTVFRITRAFNIRFTLTNSLTGGTIVVPRQSSMAIDVDVSFTPPKYYRRKVVVAGEPQVHTVTIMDHTVLFTPNTDSRPIASNTGNVSTRYQYGILDNGDTYVILIPSALSGQYLAVITRRDPALPRITRLVGSDPSLRNPEDYDNDDIASEKLYLTPPTPVVPLGLSHFVDDDVVFTRRDTRSNSYVGSINGALTKINLTDTKTYTLAGDGVISGYDISPNRAQIPAAIPPSYFSALLEIGTGPSGSNQCTYGAGGFYKGTTDQSTPKIISSDGLAIQNTGLVTLPAGVNSALSSAISTAYPSAVDTIWHLLIPPNRYTWRGMVVIMAIDAALTVTIARHPVFYTTTASGDDVTINSVTLGAVARTQTTANTLSLVTPTLSSLSIGSFSVKKDGPITTWVLRTGLVYLTGGGAYLTSIESYTEDSATPGTFTYVSEISLGYRPAMVTAHKSLGQGLLISDAGFGAFTKFVEYPNLGFEWVVATPRPAEGFYLNVTENISVLLGGVYRTIPTGVYDVKAQIPNPESTTIRVYIKLVAGIPQLIFRTSYAAESGILTYIGGLVTDANGITGSTLRSVTRIGLDRPRAEGGGNTGWQNVPPFDY